MTHEVPPLRTGARAAGLAAAVLAVLLVGTVAIWIDPEGRTILTDGEDPPRAGAVQVGPEESPHP